ncbi:unnamed protein product [Rangifer tarandus platyrhynchus]|uniref:Uncharacterized protein n=1 Tax=Rangifer tarandus platyrhynchus TaxID=3082113 RepID=A0AC59YJQ5_RANTA
MQNLRVRGRKWGTCTDTGPQKQPFSSSKVHPATYNLLGSRCCPYLETFLKAEGLHFFKATSWKVHQEEVPQSVEGQQSISECGETHKRDELLDQDALQVVSLGDTLEAVLNRNHREEEGMVDTGPYGSLQGP